MYRRTDKRVVGLDILRAVPVWIGRDSLVKQLQYNFLQSPVTDRKSTLRPKVLVLVGQGGIGKTSLAAKLLEASGIDLQSGVISPNCPYDVALCFKAEENTSFDELAEFLLEELGVMPLQSLKTEGQKISRIVQGLQQQQTIILIDELEVCLHPTNHLKAGYASDSALGKLLNRLVYSNHQSQIILTSREIPENLADARYDNSEPDPALVLIETLNGVTINDSVKILRQRGLRDSEEDLFWVAERLDGHVFLLTQLAAIAKDKPGYLRKHPELVTQRAEPILKEQLARQSDASLELLKRMSVLREKIDIKGLTFLRLYTDAWRSNQELLEASGVVENYPELTEADEEETQVIIERLVSCSLVEYRYDEKQCELFYDLHRVIKEFLQRQYHEELPNLLKNVYLFYNSEKNVGNPKNIKELRHILEAQFFAFQIGDINEAFSILRWKLDDYLKRWGHWNVLKTLYEQLLPLVDENEQVDCLNSIGDIYREFGNLDLAENHFNKAVSKAEKQGIKENIELCSLHLQRINNIRQSDIIDELSFNNKTQYKILYPNSDFPKFLEEFNREHWRIRAETQRKCLEFQLKNYEDFIKEHPGSDMAASIAATGFVPGIAESMGKLGEAELNSGNIENAEKALIDALELMQKWGMMKQIAFTNYHLARLERLRGNAKSAENYYIAACDIFQNLGAVRDLEGIKKAWIRNI